MPVRDLPIIAYDNLLTQGTVTANGSNGANAYDWFQDDVWTTAAATGTIEADMGATTETCDYWAISTHTCGTRACTIKLQYWTGAAYADVPGSSKTLADANDDIAIVQTFEPKSAVKFQLVITTDGTAATLAIVSFGERLEFPEGIQMGFSPPRFARRDELYNNVTQGGKFIGRSLVRTGTTGQLNIKQLDEDWARTYLDPFITSGRTQGWFLLWHPLGRPAEAAYCWTTKTPMPKQDGAQLTSVQIAYEGVTV